MDSYRKLGAKLGVADTSVMRWESKTVQMSEQNWGVVRKFYEELVWGQKPHPSVKIENYMLTRGPSELLPPIFNLRRAGRDITRDVLLEKAAVILHVELERLCPWYRGLKRDAMRNSVLDPLASPEDLYKGDPDVHWHEFCFKSCDLSKLMSEGMWNLTSYAFIARDIALGFHRTRVVSRPQIIVDVRGSTADFKIGCLVED